MSYPGVRPVPKRIRYVFPNGYKEEGRIVDRVRLRSSSKGGNYLMVIEKILWPGWERAYNTVWLLPKGKG